MTINKVCEVCKKSYGVYPSRLNTARTCSKSCMGRLKSQTDNRVNLTCDYCGRDFKRYESQLVGKFNACSKECQNLYRLKHVYTCVCCGKVFHRPVTKKQGFSRFCSSACMYKTLKVERNPINCQCSVCGKLFHKSKTAIRSGEGKFCSLFCRNTSYLGRNKNKEDAKYLHYYNKPSWKEIRLKIIGRDNYVCVDCGIKPIKTSGLQVHHIKRRILGGSDDPSNLVTLCFSCHKKREVNI